MQFKDWSLAELICARDFARLFHRWDDAAELTDELRRRGFTA